jgi:predicted transcriptional regulator
MSTTIRVSEQTRARIAALADRAGRPMTEIVDEAVDALERTSFFDAMNGRYAELRSDPATWREVEDERALEEGALGDRLE